MSDFLYYLVAFGVLLGLLIVVHELGHYLVARWVGVKVLRFSVGFGRPLLTRQIGRDRTEWSIGLFPLGGYVRMLDEGEGDVAPHESHRAFNRQSVWKRMAIVAAGPMANLLLAVLVYWGLFMHGMEELRPVMGSPIVASPAAAAGIENGERVLKVGGEEVLTWSDMRWILLRKMADQDVIDLEVINLHNEINFRRIDLAVTKNGIEGNDPLEKLGLTFFRPDYPPEIGKISPGSPAEVAGLNPGDKITSINGKQISTWADVVSMVRASPSIRLTLDFMRGDESMSVQVIPLEVERQGVRIGQIGAAVNDAGFSRQELLITVRYDFLPALSKALDETWDKSTFSLQMMGKMLTGVVSWKNISGPVTIADYAGQSAKLGLAQYLRFMALVSISLAVLNLLPVPVLDGGHLLYYVAEIVRGRPLSERCLMIGQKIGLALILMLMAFALYNDFTRLIPG